MNRRQLIGLGMGMLCGLSACRSRRPVTPLYVEMGFDPTPPDADDRARQAAAATPFFEPQDDFVLRATDNKTTIISTLLPEDDNAAFSVLQSIPILKVPITNLASYFEAVSAAAASQPGKGPLVILLYTDGLSDIDQGQLTTRIEAAAHSLAVNPRVRAVVLVGLIRETRPGWKGLPEMLACLNEGPTTRLFVQAHEDRNVEAIGEIIAKVRAAQPVSPSH